MSKKDAHPTRARGNPPPSDRVDAAQEFPFGPVDWLLRSAVSRESKDAFGELPTYSMSHRSRGQALIFNNETFQHKSKRSGTQQDVVHLTECLTNLDFAINPKKDATHEEMKQMIAKAASEDHKDADCFLCVILSHGNDGVIFGTDSKANKASANEESTLVRLQEDVFDYFRGENCESLVGKPKIFIIQACRGLKFEKRVFNVGAGVNHTASHTIGPEVPYIEEGIKPTIPSGADFLICYSTSQGFYSFRNPEEGSWYITELCKQLNEFGKDEEISTILTRVHNKVSLRSSESTSPKACGKKQMPCYLSMLTKQLVFKPKAKQGY